MDISFYKLLQLNHLELYDIFMNYDIEFGQEDLLRFFKILEIYLFLNKKGDDKDA